MNKQTTDKSENKKNATLSDSPALAFDRDKNEIYRPQDESIVPMEHTPGGGHLPDEDPYENPLEEEHEIEEEDTERPDTKKDKVWMETNEAVTLEDTKGEFIEGERNRPVNPAENQVNSPKGKT